MVTHVQDVKNICETDEIKQEDLDIALHVSMKFFCPGSDKHAPVRKLTVRTFSAPWINEKTP